MYWRNKLLMGPYLLIINGHEHDRRYWYDVDRLSKVKCPNWKGYLSFPVTVQSSQFRNWKNSNRWISVRIVSSRFEWWKKSRTRSRTWSSWDSRIFLPVLFLSSFEIIREFKVNFSCLKMRNEVEDFNSNFEKNLLKIQ
jgi:hypothetical protein